MTWNMGTVDLSNEIVNKFRLTATYDWADSYPVMTLTDKVGFAWKADDQWGYEDGSLLNIYQAYGCNIMHECKTKVFTNNLPVDSVLGQGIGAEIDLVNAFKEEGKSAFQVKDQSGVVLVEVARTRQHSGQARDLLATTRYFHKQIDCWGNLSYNTGSEWPAIGITCAPAHAGSSEPTRRVPYGD